MYQTWGRYGYFMELHNYHMVKKYYKTPVELGGAGEGEVLRMTRAISLSIHQYWD